MNWRRLIFVLLPMLLVMEHALAKRVPVGEENTHEARKVATSGNDMRRARRMGIIAAGAGALGIGGIELELNFSPHSGIVLGFGGGSDFQAFAFEYKQVLAGEWLLPYMGMGFAKWQNFGKNGPISETTPGVLADRFLTPDNKRSGRVNESLLYPKFGLQYMQLEGDWAGFSVFAELVVLIDLNNFIAGPTGGVGVGYYF